MGHIHLLSGLDLKMNQTKERPQHLGKGYSPNFAVWRQELGIDYGYEERKGMFPATKLRLNATVNTADLLLVAIPLHWRTSNLYALNLVANSITRMTLHESGKWRAQGLCKTKRTAWIVVQVAKL